MRRFLLGGLLIGFTLIGLGCKQEYKAPDGYNFEPVERIAERPIKVVTYPSERALKNAYAKLPRGRQMGDNEHLQAFTVINSVCTIHMVDPATRYQPEFFGHELVHCLYGEFHPSQNER